MESKSKTRLLQIDPGDLSDQLFLYEHRLYSKIQPQECINWGETQTGHSVINMVAFCATHDHLVAWVQLSILQVSHHKRRAKIVDYWIKVAEVCYTHTLYIYHFVPSDPPLSALEMSRVE